MAEITAAEALAILEDAREIYTCMHDKEELTDFPFAGGTVTILQADIDAAVTRINAGITALQARVAALDPIPVV